MDRQGNGIEICREKMFRMSELRFTGWTEGDFRRWCILSGCDYIKSLPGMGLKRAYKYVSYYKARESVSVYIIGSFHLIHIC
jgi:exonuclease-1